jgi:hypothetical protein
MDSCCPKFVLRFDGNFIIFIFIIHFVGLVDHFPLNVAENMEMLNDRSIMPLAAFSFTILRNPLHQFISYHEQLKQGFDKQLKKIIIKTIPAINV